jgi:hypothetical protein
MIDPLSAETALLLNPQSEKVHDRIERQVRAEMDLRRL